MTQDKIKAYLKQLVGTTLHDVRLACEMIVLDFGKFGVHTQCFTRIIEANKILLTTLDYQSWDGVDDQNNDEWYNLAQYKSRIVNNKVTAVELTELNDLLIWLENNIHIQAFILNGPAHYCEDEDDEQWRLIIDGEKENENIHIVINRKTVDFLT